MRQDSISQHRPHITCLNEGCLPYNNRRSGLATMLTEGAWAEIKVGNEHLRLFSEHNAQGVQVSVYNVKTKSWIAPSEIVEDIEQGKERAADLARNFLKKTANAELPP